MWVACFAGDHQNYLHARDAKGLGWRGILLGCMEAMLEDFF